MPHVRPYAHADRAALYEVCLRTGDNGEDATGLFAEPTLLGEVYVGPYLTLHPEFAWTLDNDGVASGYVLGAPDTAAFELECERSWWPALRGRYPLGSFADGTRDEEVVELIHEPVTSEASLLVGYPAHLHIDLVDEVQGFGLGATMIRTLLDVVRERGVTGIHLGVATANSRAIGFYEHLGFTTLRVTTGSTTMGMRVLDD